MSTRSQGPSATRRVGTVKQVTSFSNPLVKDIKALVAQRKVTKRPSNIYAIQQVQRSTTRTAVNEAVLTDLLYPADVVARRWRFRVDGSKIMKVFLDTKARKRMDARLPLIAALYKKLTQRSVTFGYMWNPNLSQVSSK